MFFLIKTCTGCGAFLSFSCVLLIVCHLFRPVSSGDTIASDKTFVGPSSPGEFGTMGKATVCQDVYVFLLRNPTYWHEGSSLWSGFCLMRV